MADRQEFKFVIDGLELSDDQRERIGSAIQRAGLQALTEAKVKLDSPVLVGHTGLKLRKEWLGIWVLNGDLGARLGPQIEDAVGGQFG